MTDTISHNGAHDVHEVNGSTADAGDNDNEHEAAARLHEQRRVKFEARKRELNREIEKLLDARAIVVAEIARCNRLIAIERGDVKVRGRKKGAAPAKGTKR